MKLVLIFLLLVFSKITTGNNETNSILAIVNQNILTSQAIQSQLDQSKSLEDKIRIINDKINLILQQELIDSFGLNPSKDEVDRALKHVSIKNNMSLTELKEHPNFIYIENDVKKNLSIFNLKTFLTKDLNINVSQNDIKKSCQNHNSQVNKQIKIAEIIISHPPGFNSKVDNPEISSKKFLNKLSNHINKGASFISLAKLHSQDQSYIYGGVSDWKMINSELLKEIEKLNKNQVSNIYPKENGWAIAIKFDERIVNLELEECKKDIRATKAENYFVDYLNNYKNQANITIFREKL